MHQTEDHAWSAMLASIASKVNYGELPPCQSNEGGSINGALQNKVFTYGPKILHRSSYSSKIEM